MTQYCVVVSNIGTVYDGDDRIKAFKEYGEMKRASQAPHGRASGESVTLFMDGDPLSGFEYDPPPPCPECFSRDCNGECSGDGAMGG